MNYKDMTDEQLRIAVAETQGWKISKGRDRGLMSRYLVTNPEGQEIRADVLNFIPAFPNDLNACHEFEETLGIEAKWRYGKELRRLTGNLGPRGGEFEMNTLGCFHLGHATARQRCLALLATLETK